MAREYDRWFCKVSDLEGLDAVRARDLVVECFYQAQHESFERSSEAMGLEWDNESVRREVQGAVRNAFKRTGGNYDAPTKLSLTAAVDSLAETASHYGTPNDIIDHHRTQIDVALAGLAD